MFNVPIKTAFSEMYLLFCYLLSLYWISSTASMIQCYAWRSCFKRDIVFFLFLFTCLWKSILKLKRANMVEHYTVTSMQVWCQLGIFQCRVYIPVWVFSPGTRCTKTCTFGKCKFFNFPRWYQWYQRQRKEWTFGKWCKRERKKEKRTF